MRVFNRKSIISHLTDVEGNLRYFSEWFNRSKYLQLQQGKLSFRNTEANQQFIYGGDFCDKGPGDLRIGKALIDFKTKYPRAVTLIAGNREIKCRRFTYELNTMIRQRLLYGAPAFWNPHSSPRDYVILQMKTEGVHANDIERYVSNKSIEECQTLYLKWMLNETMGCGSHHHKPTTFEYRRRELAQMAGQPIASISDDRATQSFIDSVSPKGIVTQYLKQAQLGKIIGETLFIHGAITVNNMGYVPGRSKKITDAREWITMLNEWYYMQISDWLNKPTEAELHSPGHNPLDHYVIANPQSIVTTNWYTQGKLQPIPEVVVRYLNNAGIYRVISGHQPFSDFPLIIRNANLEVIVGDTGYSDPLAKEDNRGQALHNLTIIQANDHSYTSIDAIRKDGSSMILNLPSRAEIKLGNDTTIGHFTEEGQLIRPVNSSQLSASQLDGHNIIDKPLALPTSSRT
jgi:Calcineurin-like phosphoesterase